ncbi:MAG: glycosyltransferase family 4 protein [Acidobacteriota bacterium]
MHDERGDRDNRSMSAFPVVIHATEFPPGPGGIGTHACALARGLAGFGFQVHVLVPIANVNTTAIHEFASKERYAISAMPFRSPRVLEGALRLREVVATLRRLRGRTRGAPHPCLIASGSQALWVGSVAAALTGSPCMAVVHGSELDSRVRWERALMGIALRRCSAVVAVSEFTARYLQRFPVRPDRVHVIPNGADASVFGCPTNRNEARKALREKLGLGAGPILLTVGNVGPRKGQEVVIRALPEIKRHFPGVTYLMVGLPTFMAAYSRLAADLGVAAHVRFLGVATPVELNKAYNGADLFVMVSRHTGEGDFEGFGIAAVEAGLCGLPSVVTRDCGLVEAIEEGVTGVAVNQDDPVGTAAAIVSLLADPRRLREMGDNARARALQSQTWDSIVPRYARLIRNLMGETA